MNENGNIFYVGGSKGGEGKSLFTFVLANYFLEKNSNILLVDSGTDNPDVYKAHKEMGLANLACAINRLDSQNDWMDLSNLMEKYPDHLVIVNGAARTKESVQQNGEMFWEMLEMLKRRMTVFWMINIHRDSVELLHSFQQSLPKTAIHVCRNLFFGQPEQFEIYNTSKAREKVEAQGKTLDFPVLSPSVATAIYSRRQPIKTAYEQMRISEKVELSRWKNRCGEMLNKVIENPKS